MGCDDGGSDETGGGTPGGITQLDAVIGSAGGKVEITDPASPIYRAGAYIQPDILSEDTSISVSWSENRESWSRETIAAGEVIRFDPDGIRFDEPVRLFLPYKDDDSDGIVDGTEIDEDNVRAMFFNTESGMWKDVPVSALNTEENIISVETNHFSHYTAAIYLAGECAQSETLYAGPYYFTLYFDFRHGSDSFRAAVSGVGVDYNAGNAVIADESHAILEDDGFRGLFDKVIDARQWTWAWAVLPSVTFLTKNVALEDDEVEVGIVVTGPTSVEFSWNFDYRQMAPDETLAVKFSGSTDTLCRLLDRSPRMPQNVTIGTVAENSIDIYWDDIVCLYSNISYNMYISEDGGDTFSLLTISTEPRVTVSGLDTGTSYFFKVTAVYHGSLESADSQTVSGTTL